MKIIFYYYMGGGGGLSNIILLLSSMARCNPEDTIEVVTSQVTPLDSLENVRNLRIRRFRVTGNQEVDRMIVGLFFLRKVIRESEADIIWSMNLGPYTRVTIPSVLSIHNPHQVYPWEVHRYHPGKPWHVAILRWLFRRSLRRSDAVIVQTSAMGEYVQRIPGSPQRQCVVPKAVEREEDVQPEALPPPLQTALDGGLGRTAFTFLYVATGVPHKNHVTILKSFSELARRNVKARVILTITREEINSVGWCDTSHLMEAGYIVPTDWVAKRHLRALYAACDACLMPSVLESLSSAHIEAMQWGRPQITADLRYARDICGRAALYADAENEKAWVEQIQRLMCDADLRDKLVRAGYDQMSQYPGSWDEAAEKVHRFLESVVYECRVRRKR